MSKLIEQAEKIEVGKNIRNFKQSDDVENFYRFINDNKLRREAKMILEAVMVGLKRMNRKKREKKVQ